MNIVDFEHGEDKNESPPRVAADASKEPISPNEQNGQNPSPKIGRSKSKSNSKPMSDMVPSSLLLAYQSFGVVYGDLSISPLYVYNNAFEERLRKYESPDIVFGVFSLIFWTLTLIPLLKYVFIILIADDNGEGGTFALYSLLCRHAKLSLLPNQQAADEELSAYRHSPSGQSPITSGLKRYLEKHKKSRTSLLIIVLLGAGMVIGDGIINPAMSVLSSMSGLKVATSKLNDTAVLVLVCVILVGLFAVQHFGTHRVGFLFAPIVILWLISIFGVGLYNTIHWNPRIVRALSPHYIVKFFSRTGKDGWLSLGGVLLCITGTEAMFADLGHFNACSIRTAFVCLVYPCLVVQYMGQAAYLSKNIASIQNSFYDSIPDPVIWPVFIISTLAAIVASQAIISATFSIVKQCQALGCFPRVKIVHTSKQIYGQIYIPEINWFLMILTLAIAIGFPDTRQIGNAYGLAVLSVMLITTFLMTLVIIFVWQKNVAIALVFLAFFWSIEGCYLTAAYTKVPQGGWVSLLLSLIFTFIMFVWHYGTRKKYTFDSHNKVPLKWILGLGPSLGIVRVPGIGLIYSELATGVPPIFSHFVTNLPAFHNVLVFVCMKSVPVPYVAPEERFLIGRVCPRPYRMYRCIVRYGYNENQGYDGNFENLLIQSIAEFIQMEARDEPEFSSPDCGSHDGRMAVIGSREYSTESTLTESEVEELDAPGAMSRSSTIQSIRPLVHDEENPQVRRRHVRFQLPPNPSLDPSVREELLDLIRAKEAGIAYIMGHSYVKARRSSSCLKRLIIDYFYAFLRKNCRGSAVGLHIPQISLIEVGMMYHV